MSPLRDAVARELGYAPTTVRNKINKARERKLLTEGLPGKAGGELTERALILLEHSAR